MAKYIKEDEMREVIDKWQESLSPRIDLRDSVIFDTLESVNFHIDNLATADVVEVVHGEWIPTGGETLFLREFKCSRCRSKGLGNPNYCSNCGAKMDGKKVE